MSHNYIICSTQRSGSSLLCHLMRQSGVLGKPGESIVLGKIKKYAENKNIEDLFIAAQEIIESNRGSNGVAGVKIHYHQFEQIKSKLSFFDLLGDDIKWIYIDRKSQLEQAVSLAKAWQTREFSSKHQATDSARYCFETINKAGKLLVEEKSSWEWLFQALNINPLRIYYEDLLNDDSVNIAVEAIAKHVDVEFEKRVKLQDVGIKKQSDESSLEWVKSFIEDYKAQSGL